MNASVLLLQGIKSLEAELEVELARRRIELNFVVNKGKIHWDPGRVRQPVSGRVFPGVRHGPRAQARLLRV
jgi:hypothetical protein